MEEEIIEEVADNAVAENGSASKPIDKDGEKKKTALFTGLETVGKGLREMKFDYFSDANLKSIYGNIDDRIIEDFAKISAIDFSYKPEVQNKYQETFGIDSDEHTGVIAQELENTESTKSAVSETPEGTKVVDTKELTMADTAAIAELSRRVLALEQVVKELINR